MTANTSEAMDERAVAKEFYGIYCKASPYGFTGAGWVPFDELPVWVQAPWREMAARANLPPPQGDADKVDAMLKALRVAVVALAHATMQTPGNGVYEQAYQAVDAAIDMAAGRAT